MNQVIECPNHEGSFDCTTFCAICGGNQEFTVTTERLIAQEKQLDEAQAILEKVYREVRILRQAYSSSDVRDIEDAILALDRITLRKDVEMQNWWKGVC